MTLKTNVFLKEEKLNNETIFNKKINDLFASGAVSHISNVHNIVRKLLLAGLFDCKTETNVNEAGSKEVYKFFNGSSDIPAIKIITIKLNPTTHFRPLIRHTKTFNEFNKMLVHIEDNIKQPFLQCIIETMQLAMPKTNEPFACDIEVDEGDYLFTTEFNKSHINISIHVNASQMEMAVS